MVNAIKNARGPRQLALTQISLFHISVVSFYSEGEGRSKSA